MMELTIQTISRHYPNGMQVLKALNRMILLCLCGLLGSNDELKHLLLCVLVSVQEPGKGHLLFEDIDIARYTAQLLQFMLETMF